MTHTTANPPPHARSARWLLAPTLTLLAACSATPKLPVADDATRRPVNAPGAIELQACRNELHNSRLLASESTRLAEATTAAMHQLVLAQGGSKSCAPAPDNASARGTASTVVYTFLFDNHSSTLNLPEDSSRALLQEAKEAALIVVRGRTDAATDTPATAKTARDRAESAKALLTKAGIDAQRIRVTWQAVGDHVADNRTAAGRALNRRVELELYRTAPIQVAVPPRSPQATSVATQQ